MTTLPSVLVFDVNETLIDIESMAPVFGRIFGDPAVMREWFGQLLVYSMTATLAGQYVDFFTLGQGVLRMVADTRRVEITGGDVQALKQAMLTMPAHPDVEDGLTVLRDNGFRLVDTDQLTAESGRTQPTGERRAEPLVRAPAERRCLPGVQTRARDLSLRARAIAGSARRTA